MLRALACCIILAALLVPVAWANADALNEPMVGCYPCDSLCRNYWHDGNSPWADLNSIELLREYGFEWLRLGVTTQSHAELAPVGAESRGVGWEQWKDGYWSCLEMGERALSDASAEGMKLCVFLFLSDTAAHGGQQEPPAAWRDMDVQSTCEAMEQYGFETAERFKARDLDIAIYEIGNEIERGICGFRPFERVPCPQGVDQLRDIPWMQENIWKPEALLLAAAIRGIKRADPDGEIMLHAATRPSPEDGLVVAFFEAMVRAGVPFDYAGLSFYPWIGYPSAPPNEDWRSELATWVSGIAELGKKVIIAEYSYPHHPVDPQPGTVALPLPGFPFSPLGQAAWVREFLDWCRAHPAVAGSFYFYPDYIWSPEQPGSQTEGLFLSDDGEVVPSPALLEIEALTARSRRANE